MNIDSKAWVVVRRFIKAGIGGAFGAMAAVIGLNVQENGFHTLTDINLWIASLAFAGMAGFISGIVLAGEKWYNYQ